MLIKNWNIEELTGYTPKTTYYTDFSIADNFGVDAIKDTYTRIMGVIESMGYVYLTEFVMVLNWKIWEHYGSNLEIAEVYNNLWEEAREFAVSVLSGDELSYYYATTD